MFIVDISDPITLLLLTLGTVLLIFLGKELKKPYVPGLTLFAYLGLVVFHVAQIVTLGEAFYAQYHSVLLRCISIDCVMIFVAFFAYLWIDDIACRTHKRKSIDNSLDVFWRNV